MLRVPGWTLVPMETTLACPVRHRPRVGLGETTTPIRKECQSSYTRPQEETWCPRPLGEEPSLPPSFPLQTSLYLKTIHTLPRIINSPLKPIPMVMVRHVLARNPPRARHPRAGSPQASHHQPHLPHNLLRQLKVLMVERRRVVIDTPSNWNMMMDNRSVLPFSLFLPHDNSRHRFLHCPMVLERETCSLRRPRWHLLPGCLNQLSTLIML